LVVPSSKSGAPIILIGRSGTGKTTCCLYRLWYTFQNHWTNADCDDDKCTPEAVHNNLTNADYDDDKCSPETEPLLDDGTTNYIVSSQSALVQ
jgi:hypothetical protein